MPKHRKNGPQEPSDRLFNRHSTADHAADIRQPQVAAANGKAKIQPAPSGGEEEQQIRRCVAAAPQRTQKAIEQTECHADQTGSQKPPGGGAGRRHPSRRRSQPPGLRGSS